MNTHSIRILVCPAIKAIVRSVEAPLWEPDNVSVLESARTDSREWSIPGKHVYCRLSILVNEELAAAAVELTFLQNSSESLPTVSPCAFS